MSLPLKSKPNFKKRPKERTYIFGRQPVLEALKTATPIEKLMIKRGAKGAQIEEIKQLAKQQYVTITQVPTEKLNWLTQKNHQGVVGFLSVVQYQNLEDVLTWVYEQGETPLFLVLDGVTDVRNFGAIVRSAACMGVHAVVIPSKGNVQLNEDALKTSAGALLQIPICRINYLKDGLESLQNNGFQIVATSLNAENSIQNVDLTAPTALVLGSEGSGISSVVEIMANNLVKIPMKGNFDSLNVSVAAGIILYETLRQRLGSKEF